MLEKLIRREVIHPPVVQERAERQMTVLINAAIVQQERDGLCRIRNMSQSGLNVETSVPLAIGEPATITLHSGRTLDCVVRWCRDNRVGMSCESDPTDVLQGERAVPAADLVGPALPRFSRQLPVDISVHGVVYRCALDSISTKDVLLTDVPARLPAAQTLTLCIPGLGEIPAAIRASELGAMFARFLTPLPFTALDRWLTASDWARLR